MKIWLDHALLKKSAENHASYSFHEDVVFDWPCLLVYIGAGTIFQRFPLISENSPLFTRFKEAFLIQEKELQSQVLTELFDQLFIDCLTAVKDLDQVDASFLLSHIEKRQKEKLYLPSLNHYQHLLQNDPYTALHDLTLYLAYDRVCVSLAIVFEQAEKNSDLSVLRDCLIESFHHITKQGQTKLSFFRLAETLYAYQMREEYLDSYSEADWAILCKSALSLRPRDELIDAVYIDPFLNIAETMKVMTLDSPEKIEATLLLSKFMINYLKTTVPYWDHKLYESLFI